MVHDQVQIAAVLASPTGNVPWNYGSIISTSFISVVLLNLVEPHIPYGPAKSILKFSRKNIVGFPVGVMQYAYNYGLRLIEKRFFNTTLPINITDTNLLLDSSTLRDLEELKGPTSKLIQYIYLKN